MSVSVGDLVSWNSSGGTARGIIRQIVRDGTVPNIPFKVTGSKEEPAARIEIVDDAGKPTGEMVGHKISTLRKSDEVEKAEYQGREVPLNKPRRLSGGNKKFEVFVMDGDKVKRVTFGDPNMEIRRDDDKARASFRARHSCDTAKDKTSARYWSCRMWEKDTTVSEATKSDFEVIKVDTEQRIVYGWASVTKVDDELLVDRQGDIIETETLHKAVNDFMKSVRVGKLMHQGDKVGEIIHSFPVSKEIMGALGIQTNKEGWITGYYVEDDNLWEDVKSGKYAAFSIGGAAVKEEYNA